MKIRQFPESVTLSSWRTQEVNLAPHELYDIGFTDTSPNIFVVNNPNEATLKFGISKIPTSEKYEYKIDYSSSDVFGRPTGSGHLYVLNDSSIPVSFTLFSIKKDFDPEILKGTNVRVELDNAEMRTIIQGFGEGVKFPVDNTEVLAQLSAIFNKLEVPRLKGEATYYNNVTQVNQYCGYNAFFVFDWIFNDGDDAEVTVGDKVIFVVKKGEGFGEMEFDIPEGKQLTVKSSSGTASLRVKYHVEINADEA